MDKDQSKPLDSKVQYSVGVVPFHVHNGIDSPKISTGSTSINARSHGSGVTSIPGSFTPTKITLNVNDFTNGVKWDSGNNRFSILTAGQYIIIGQVSYTNTTSGKQYETMIYINGSEVSQGRQTSAATTAQIDPSVSDIKNLSVGDYIELYTQQNDTGNNSISAGSGLTFLAIAKV